MNVALPEVDGRILARAVSFKAEARFDNLTECPIVAYVPRRDRVAFTADLARAWIDLAGTPVAERRIGIVLANYPNRDGRLGNGVGLDTPAGTVELLRAMAAAGYDVEGIPEDGNALIEAIAAGPTNAGVAGRAIRERLALDDYLAFFAALPAAVREAVRERWGEPEGDPYFLAEPGEGEGDAADADAGAGANANANANAGKGAGLGTRAGAAGSADAPGDGSTCIGVDAGVGLGAGAGTVGSVGAEDGAGGGAGFAVPAIRFGNAIVGLQPARGYHIDPAATYHDPDLVPPTATSPSTPGCGSGRGCTR